MGFDVQERDISDVFSKERLNPIRVRMLQGPDGKFKGAAFVEFDNKDEAEKACKLDGRTLKNRSIRVNPAGNKPNPR